MYTQIFLDISLARSLDIKQSVYLFICIMQPPP